MGDTRWEETMSIKQQCLIRLAHIYIHALCIYATAGNTSNVFPDLSPDTEILARQLTYLHIIRSMLGPLIEDLIFIDRTLFLRGQWGSWNIRAVN